VEQQPARAWYATGVLLCAIASTAFAQPVHRSLAPIHSHGSLRYDARARAHDRAASPWSHC